MTFFCIKTSINVLVQESELLEKTTTSIAYLSTVWLESSFSRHTNLKPWPYVLFSSIPSAESSMNPVSTRAVSLLICSMRSPGLNEAGCCGHELVGAKIRLQLESAYYLNEYVSARISLSLESIWDIFWILRYSLCQIWKKSNVIISLID